jgi:hypothetical protein
MIGRVGRTVVLHTARENSCYQLVVGINLYAGAKILAKCMLLICYKLIGGWTFNLCASVCTFLLYTVHIK